MLDLRIIDTTRLLPGPYATWLLAQMGADVIKVERPPAGDYLRDELPGAFDLYNAGKRSVAIDLKQPHGTMAFLDLVAGADAVIDGNRPGVMDRLGCGWERCQCRRPTLVYCALTGFGQNGPYRDRAGHDLDYLAISGLLARQRDTAGRPVVPQANIADMLGGLGAATGLLGAVIAARSTGVGRFVDVSMLDLAISIQGRRIASELLDPNPAGVTDASPDRANTWEAGVYETADGRWLALDPYERSFKDELWRIVAHETGRMRPEAAAGAVALCAALTAAILERPLQRWEALLAEVDACYAPVLDLSEVIEVPHVRARRTVLRRRGEIALASPLRFDPAVAEQRPGAPRLGEHTDEVMAEAGWTSAQMTVARGSGALL